MAAMELWPALFAPEAYGVWRDVIEAAPERMFPQILARFRGGRDVPAADFVAAWRRLADLRQAWTAACAGYDAVILPTAPNLPPNAARLLEDEDHYVTENLRTLSYTRIGNLMGAAGLTITDGRALGGAHAARAGRLGGAATSARGGGRGSRDRCSPGLTGEPPRRRRAAASGTANICAAVRTKRCASMPFFWTSRAPAGNVQRKAGRNDPATEASMVFPERFSALPAYAFPRLRALLDGVEPGAAPIAMSLGEPKHAPPAWLGEEMARHTGDFTRYPPNVGHTGPA